MVINVFNYLLQHKIKAVIVLLLWTAFIFYACLKPGNSYPVIKIPHIDKLVHLLMFAVQCFLFFVVIKPSGNLNKYLILLISIALGVLIEMLQASKWVINRSFDYKDIIADSIGSLSGMYIFYYFWKRSESKIK